MKWKSLLLCGVLLSAAGCADVVAVQEGTRIQTGPRLNGMEADPPTDWPVRITDAGVHVFADGGVNAYMTYDAYHASIGGNGYANDVRGLNTYTFSNQEQHTSWAFFGNRFAQNFSVPTYYDCGTHIRADVSYRAWWQGLGPGGTFTVQEEKTTRSGEARQDPCPTEDVEEERTGGGGDTSGGGGLEPDLDVKTTTCVIRYTYDIATGEIINVETLYCYDH